MRFDFRPLLLALAGSTLLSYALIGFNIIVFLLVAGCIVVTVPIAYTALTRLFDRPGGKGPHFYVIQPSASVTKTMLKSRVKSLFDLSRAVSSECPVLCGQVCADGRCELVVGVFCDNETQFEKMLPTLLKEFRIRRVKVKSLDDLSKLFRVKVDVDNVVPSDAFEPTVSLGAKNETKGEVLIGVDDSGGYIYASIDEFWRHTGIFGTTGSGKTTTAAFLAKQLSKYLTVIVLDWHGEYPHVLERMGAVYEVVEPPTLPLIPRNLDVELSVDVLEDAFDLTRHQSMILYQALKQMIKRGIPEDIDSFTDNLLATIEVQQALPSRAELEIRAALERRLRTLATGEGRKLFTVYGDIWQPEKPGLYVISVNRILLLTLRRIYVRMFLAYLYYIALAYAKKVNTIVVIEEAHNIASPDSQTVPIILAEARKHHLGLIVVTQSPSSLHPSILKNTNIRIVHTLKSAHDISVVSRSMNLPKQLKEVLPRLQPGQAVVDTPQLAEPSLVRIPAYELDVIV